ncbi:MAG: hypothetical protein GY842_10615 [bacterium]|nr:hypothetical protein [bacterium]
MVAQVSPPHPAGIMAVGERTLTVFGTPLPELLPAITANATTIGMHRVTLGFLAHPNPTVSVRLRNIRANVAVVRILQDRVAVITLVPACRVATLPEQVGTSFMGREGKPTRVSCE